MLEKPSQGRSVEQLIREFFRDYPDYSFCSTLAENVEAGVTTYANALTMLGRKQATAEESRADIEEKLNARTVTVDGHTILLKNLSLREAMDLEDEALRQTLEFYYRRPYAHRRTRRTRLLPRWARAFFLNALVGHAHRRGIHLDYASYFAMLKML
jgi:hypothetical protein